MKKQILIFLGAGILFFGSSFLLKALLKNEELPQASAVSKVERIISLAPSLTEMIYLLDIDNKLVGNTAYCNYPPEAKNIEKVGGYSTPDFEKIVLLKPDIVLMMDEHKYVGLDEKFNKLGINTLFLSAKKTDSIINSIREIGKQCGAEEAAEAQAARLEKMLKDIAGKTYNPSPVIILTVGKNMGSGGLKTVFAAGKGTYYDDLISIAGGRNGTPVTSQEYVNLSGEEILKADPDIIIDIVPNLPDEKEADVIKTWKAIPGLKAVKNGNVYIFTEEYAARPGPSFPNVLKDIQNCLEQWNSSQ